MSSGSCHSSNRVHSSYNNGAAKLCGHGVEAIRFTSMTDDNPCRRFWRCRFYKKDNDCKYFEWIDPELPPFQRCCFVNLKCEKSDLHDQLKCKADSEKLLSEILE
ncbi:hypothetical protein ACS0TY_024171 [Phlomoides rotata]